MMNRRFIKSIRSVRSIKSVRSKVHGALQGTLFTTAKLLVDSSEGHHDLMDLTDFTDLIDFEHDGNK